MRKITAKDLRFGDIDARHEILARDEGKRQLFLDSFMAPPSFDIKNLINGEKFLIYGPKGSGKTAFLRYLQHRLAENKNSISRFIVFKDDITAQDREKLVTLSQFRIYENGESEENSFDELDCLNAWQLFIHREISHVISRSPDIVARTNEVVNYCNLLNSVFSQFKTAPFKQMLKRLTKGRLKIGGLGAELEAEAEFIDKHGNIDVSEFVRYCNEVASTFDFNFEKPGARINIFFDEVNISFVTGDDFKRNAILIRDLVAACGTMNLRFAEHGLPIYVYTAIRSEVADSVESTVRELQKWIDDKAVKIDWIIPNEDFSKQPIIGLVERRVAANEKRILDLREIPKEISLEKYFDNTISGHPFRHFLLFETWGRPRDLVRILNLMSDSLLEDGKFDHRCFRACSGKYSLGSWEEKKDELSAKYS